MKNVLLFLVFTLFIFKDCAVGRTDEQKAKGQSQRDKNQTDLVEALKKGDVEQARAALMNGADVERISLWTFYGDLVTQEYLVPEEGVFYAFFGADDKQLELIKLLLEYKARPIPHLVWYAASTGKKALLEQFLACKANPNAKSRWGTTPLAGAQDSYAYVLKKIQEVGPEEANKPHKNQMNGLMEPALIVEKQDLEDVIQMLKKAGAKETAKQ